MTAVGTMLGASAFVAILGISTTVSQQVSSSFDLRRATEVIVSPQTDDVDPDWQAPGALARLRALNGVVSAGSRLSLGELPIARGVSSEPKTFPVTGADPGALAVIEPRMVIGHWYEQFHEARAVPVVLLARQVADALGITRIGVAVFILDRAYTVAGIFDDVSRRPEALLGVLMPASVAANLVDRATALARDVVIATAPGAAQMIGTQATLALRPEGPERLRAIAPPDPKSLRQEIEKDVTQSVLWVSVIALVVGAVSIANSATASIATRVPEIGLRRALGARPSHIFAQLIGETTALGTIGGLIGVMVGIVIIALVSLANSWIPVLDVRAAVLAVVAGAGTGLVAGLLPAARATRIQPVAALQR